MPTLNTPGYFRIGFVVLDIPPTDISTNRVINDDQIATLRGSTPMFIKSGQSRWDVTVRWKAVRVILSDGSFDYGQWQNLRRIVAMFKASPFVEVENDFLRQHFTNVQEQYQTQRMAFALKQLRVDTNPDSSNVLDVTMTMALFNYAPYSKDFGYVGARAGLGVNANESTNFETFITSWISGNMDKHPADWSSPPIQAWEDQDEGVLTLKWRRYIYVPFKSSPAPSISPSTGGFTPIAAKKRVPQRVGTKKLTEEIKKIIDTSANKFGLNPAIVEAQCLYESGGDPNAVSSSGAIGLMQLLPSTARGLGVDPNDPVQNVEGACKYLSQLLKRFGNYPHALGAYNAGAGYITAYRDGKPVKTKAGGTINPESIKTDDGLPPAGIPSGENVPKYVNTIMTNAGRSQDLTTVPIRSNDAAPPPSTTSTTALNIPDQGYLQAVTQAINSLPPGEWWLDHYSELGAFFYEDENITMASGDSDVEGDFDIFPSQFSVVMVNNLPIIPLSAMQYPTFQHVGPTDTIITVGMNSVGDDDGFLSEPSHTGIQSLAAMISDIENQFHTLRTAFRAVSSIHRMQSVFVENKILNMMGIHGTIIRGLNTETVPDSSNLVQATILASQYENIFEESTPFRINGVSGSYRPTLRGILTSGELDKLSKEEQNAYQLVKAFADAWAVHNESFAINEMLTILTEPQDFLSSVNTPPMGIWNKQRDDLFAALDNDKNVEASGDAFAISSAATPQRDIYPGLEIRRQKIFGKPIELNYADYLVLTNLPEVVDTNEIASIKSTVETTFASQKPDMMEEIYSRLFDWKLLTDPAFSRQATAITNSPAFKDRFDQTIKIEGSAVQPGNENHQCYKDLGIDDYKQTPAGYFVDYSSIVREDATSTINDILGSSNQTANLTNQTQTVNGGSNVQNGFEFSANAQGLPGAGSALARMTSIPAYSMNTAFPTYKLLLLEEDNSGPFFAFDNFYSYASVIDIEVIKYRDKPDTAIIQISNLAHLLQHRMYDDTAAGKMEKDADRFNTDPAGGLVVGGPNAGPNEVGTGGNPNASIIAGKTADGQPYQIYPKKNLTEGRGEPYSRIPLKFFALQTGSKIQVRVGFSNNPDGLFPIFTGQVTQIDGDDILTLTCQSFMLDLMSVPGTTVQKNTRLGFNFLSGGAAFGGYSLSSSGDTLNVMKTMLRSPAARHFGRWQIGSQPDPKIKGFQWTELAGEAMEGASNSTISKLGALLQTGYDRSGENILVNSSINIDASKPPSDKANAGRRTFDNENPNLFLGSARYGIDKQSKRSIWDIVKDISRRYAHYNLMVRDYGFPYGADATLVYAHPLDWYYSRPPLYGDAEREIANNVTHGQLFSTWWSSVGANKWKAIWEHYIPDSKHINLPSFGGISVALALSEAQAPMTDLASRGPQEFSDATSYIHGVITGSNTNSNIPFLYRLAAHLTTAGNQDGGFFNNLDQSFQALYREWLAYLQLSDPAANSSRIKPVRKYHLIDHNHIVHNGLTVNDQIYNAVKVSDESPIKFNQNIPDQHTRVLDVTDMIEDIDNNVLHGIGNPLLNAYAQSFLRDEVGKMYQGEIILRGVPEIEPFDVILINDMSTGMVGPVEVDTVIHSFNMENGYVTIIKPRLLILANESVSLGIIQALGFAWANASANLHDLGTVFDPFNLNTAISARIVETGAVAGVLLAGAAAFAWAPPLGLTLAALGLLAGYGILTFVENRQQDNFFKIMPLSRFGRPWIGGLQGFAISNFAFSLGQKFRWFDAEEIAPTIESWNEFLHFRNDYLPQR